MKDLVKLGLWSDTMKQRILVSNGSIQGIDEIPQDIKISIKLYGKYASAP